MASPGRIFRSRKIKVPVQSAGVGPELPGLCAQVGDAMVALPDFDPGDR